MTNPENPDTIQLDPEKVLAALKESKGSFLGQHEAYWAEIVGQYAQRIADEATIDEYDDYNLEALGYD